MRNKHPLVDRRELRGGTAVEDDVVARSTRGERRLEIELAVEAKELLDRLSLPTAAKYPRNGGDPGGNENPAPVL
jgi:hypothetical protein